MNTLCLGPIPSLCDVWCYLPGVHKHVQCCVWGAGDPKWRPVNPLPATRQGLCGVIPIWILSMKQKLFLALIPLLIKHNLVVAATKE